MKVCILGLDGLEANIVEKANLQNLLQNYHGVYQVDSEKFKTPELWASILTGVAPEEFDLNLHEKEFKVINIRLPSILRALGKKIPVLGTRTRRALRFSSPSIKNKYKTIFDHAQKPLPYNVFSYNEAPEIYDLRSKMFIQYPFKDPKKRIKLSMRWGNLTNRQLNHFLKLITEKEWDLAMTHVHYSDVGGHLHFDEKDTVQMIYSILDEHASSLKDIFDKNTVFIIVSDHGMERGIHTDHGFWSSNIKLPSQPQCTTDFYHIILELLSKN